MVWPICTASMRLLVLVGCLSALVACTRTPQPIVSPSAGSAPAPTASNGASGNAAAPTASDGATVFDDPPGSMACGELRDAVTGATLMEAGVVDRIVRYSSSADAPVADSAQRLAAAYAAAVAAHGTDNEPDAVAAVSVAGADMSTICDESGLDTVG
jgi:hypothetical protein